MKRGSLLAAMCTGELPHALECLRSIGIRVDETGLGARCDLAGKFYAVTHGLIKSLIAPALNASMSSSGSSLKSCRASSAMAAP